jgi:tetratricopeptide (TPR) repeat protein
VIEKYSTTARFDNDGTSELTLTARARVQSEAGAQKGRDIFFPYNSATEKIRVQTFRIHKPDGTAVDLLATSAAVKDQVSALAANASAYGNLKELHLLAPSLEPGDTLEYSVVTQHTKPTSSGEFWFEHNFIKNVVVLDERLELDLPHGRTFEIKSPGFAQIPGKPVTSSPSAPAGFAFTRTDESGRTILRWKHANLKPAAEATDQPKDPRARTPDVQLTSFANWNAVARWYTETRQSGSRAAPELTAKTREIMASASDAADKTRAIYTFVAQKIRYIQIPQSVDAIPHLSPAQVLSDGYGDSLDKAELLAAMLDAAGIRADIGFLPSARPLDRELPAPTQLDHAMVAVPENGNLLWLDANSEVAPFAFLAAPLRGKPSLLVSADGAGHIALTPLDPPFPSAQYVEIEGKITELAKFVATIHYSLRGDTEFVLRSAFHEAPREEWSQLAQTILTLDGLRGEVTRVQASDPLETEKPFELTFEFSEPNVFAWPTTRARIALPLLTIGMPDEPANARSAVELGSPLDVQTRLKLTLPPTFTAQAPIGVAVSRDYAEFRSGYHFENGTLTAERSLNFRMRELPASRAGDYAAFTRAVSGDEAQTLLIENGSKATSIPASATADDLFEAGSAALKAGNTPSAITLLERATELQPRHKQAWNELGLAYLQFRKFEQAAAAFRKQAEVNPSDEHAHDYLGIALVRLNRPDDAAAAFRQQIELDPLDTIAHAELGELLLAQRNYPDAVPELEKAAILAPEDPRLEVSLGRAYAGNHEEQKAAQSFDKALELSPTPPIWNDVAFSLAESGIELDRALQYAELAVRAEDSALAKLDIDQAKSSDFARVEAAAAYWDTLGWVHFKRDDSAGAERYIAAAWRIGGSSAYAEHLAEIYEKLGLKDRATETYAAALAAPNPSPEARARLILLLGGNAQIEDLVAKARREVERSRTYEVKAVSNQNASADFLVLFSARAKNPSDSEPATVRFVGGSEPLRSYTDRLRSINFAQLVPEGSSTKVLMRGRLNCSAQSAACTFELLFPGEAEQN